METTVKEENKEQHKWWHILLGYDVSYKFYRDGMLGKMTPDIDETHKCCNVCKYKKIIVEIYK